MAWDPAQYLKFAGPRLRPALDLLQRIDVEAPEVVYDLGAGAGNVTRLIKARWPRRRSSASIRRPRCWPRRRPKTPAPH